jgi:hypothetical protein
MATISYNPKNSYSHTYLEPKLIPNTNEYYVVIPNTVDMLYNVWIEGFEISDVSKIMLTANDLELCSFTGSSLDFWQQFFVSKEKQSVLVLPFFFQNNGLPVCALIYNELRIVFELKSQKEFTVGVETGFVDKDTRDNLMKSRLTFLARCFDSLSLPSGTNNSFIDIRLSYPTKFIMFRPKKDGDGVIVNRAKLYFEMATRFDLSGYTLTKVIPSIHAVNIPEKEGYHLYSFADPVDFSQILSSGLELETNDIVDNIDVCSIYYKTLYISHGGIGMPI